MIPVAIAKTMQNATDIGMSFTRIIVSGFRTGYNFPYSSVDNNEVAMKKSSKAGRYSAEPRKHHGAILMNLSFFIFHGSNVTGEPGAKRPVRHSSQSDGGSEAIGSNRWLDQYFRHDYYIFEYAINLYGIPL